MVERTNRNVIIAKLEATTAEAAVQAIAWYSPICPMINSRSGPTVSHYQPQQLSMSADTCFSIKPLDVGSGA